MSEVQAVVSQTGPSLFGTLTQADGTPYDLTGATVRWQMRPAIDRRFSVDASAVVVDAAAGEVRYDWADGDLAYPGGSTGFTDYIGHWRILAGDGTVIYSVPENTVTLSPQ